MYILQNKLKFLNFIWNKLIKPIYSIELFKSCEIIHTSINVHNFTLFKTFARYIFLRLSKFWYDYSDAM